MKITEYLKQLRHKLNLTQEELAKKSGFKPETIAKWERGTRVPSIESVPKLAKALNIPMTEIYKICHPEHLKFVVQEKTIKYGTTLAESPDLKIPLLSSPLHAGMPLLADNNIEKMLPWIWEERALKSGTYFAVRIEGDCMSQEHKGTILHPKDIAVFKHRSTADNGDIAAYLNEDNETEVRIFYKYENEIQLRPSNLKYPVRIVKKPSELKILGVYYRKFGK